MDVATSSQPAAKPRQTLAELGIDPEARTRLHELWQSGRLRLDMPIIDLQHIWLVYLIYELEKLSQAAGHEEGREKLRRVTTELINFSTEHFALEDDLLQKFNYPEAESHHRQHMHFITFLDDRIREIRGGNLSAVSSLTTFLMDWLAMHIQRDDIAYRDYFVNHAVDLKGFFQDAVSRRSIGIDRAQAALYSEVAGSTEVREIIADNIVYEIIKIWSTHNLSISIPIIDLQHIWLISLIVELDIAGRTMQSARRTRIFNKVVENALEYANDHFRTEELIMKRFNFPGFPHHLKQHQGFADFVNRRAQEYKKGDPGAATHLVQDLKEWLVSHIAVEDRAIGIALKERLPEIQKFVRDLINSAQITVRKRQVELYNKVCGISKS